MMPMFLIFDRPTFLDFRRVSRGLGTGWRGDSKPRRRPGKPEILKGRR